MSTGREIEVKIAVLGDIGQRHIAVAGHGIGDGNAIHLDGSAIHIGDLPSADINGYDIPSSIGSAQRISVSVLVRRAIMEALMK